MMKTKDKEEYKFENLKNERHIGVLIDELVEKIGNPEAVIVYESFNERFQNKHRLEFETNKSKYDVHKTVCFTNYIRAYYKVGKKEDKQDDYMELDNHYRW